MVAMGLLRGTHLIIEEKDKGNNKMKDLEFGIRFLSEKLDYWNSLPSEKDSLFVKVDDVLHLLNKEIRPKYLVIPKVIEIINEAIKEHIKLNRIFDTDAWYYSQKFNEPFSDITVRKLGKIKKKLDDLLTD